MQPSDVRGVAERCASRHAAHVMDLVVRGERDRQVIEVFIDAETGVTAALCSAVSRDLTDTLNESTSPVGDYRLIVSSPGPDRPLRHPWQFRKHIGRQLRLIVRNEEGNATLAGPLESVDDAGMTIGGAGRVDWSSIVEAHVPLPW